MVQRQYWLSPFAPPEPQDPQLQPGEGALRKCQFPASKDYYHPKLIQEHLLAPMGRTNPQADQLARLCAHSAHAPRAGERLAALNGISTQSRVDDQGLSYHVLHLAGQRAA